MSGLHKNNWTDSLLASINSDRCPVQTNTGHGDRLVSTQGTKPTFTHSTDLGSEWKKENDRDKEKHGEQ